MSKTIKRGLIITCILAIILAVLFSLAIMSEEEFTMSNGNRPLMVFVYGIIALMMSLMFAYITICLNDDILWTGILILYVLFLFWIILRITKIILCVDNSFF